MEIPRIFLELFFGQSTQKISLDTHKFGLTFFSFLTQKAKDKAFGAASFDAGAHTFE